MTSRYMSNTQASSSRSCECWSTKLLSNYFVMHNFLDDMIFINIMQVYYFRFIGQEYRVDLLLAHDLGLGYKVRYFENKIFIINVLTILYNKPIP